MSLADLDDSNVDRNGPNTSEILSEEERFLRNIPRLYYGCYRLLKCILHPGLFEYMAATYFKKEMRNLKRKRDFKNVSDEETTRFKHSSSDSAHDNFSALKQIFQAY